MSVWNAILPSDNGLAYGVIHVFVFLTLEIAGDCLWGEFPWYFWHVLCHHLDKTHTDVQFRCHSYPICRLESLYVLFLQWIFFLSPLPHPLPLPLPLWQSFSMVAGNVKFAQGLQTYLLSRDHSILKSEFQLGNGKVCLSFLGLCPWVTENNSILSYILSFFFFFLLQITVSCIENLPPINLVLGEHVFLTVGDYLSRTKKSGWRDWYIWILSFFSYYNASLP